LLAQLAAGLAHQLRNALTGARLSVQLHEKRCELARGEPSMGVALRQLALVEEQVRGLLTLGRLESRPHVLSDLGRLVREATYLLQPTCEHSRVELLVTDHQPAALAAVDEPGVRAAVLNLALNAIEAAGPGGVVRLEIVEDRNEWTIRVSDNGPGPPAPLSESLFDPFVTAKPEGVGLGLALAKQVAGAHHGTLSWWRDAGWTQFGLTLPRELEARETH
jgi:signal transduction histidine kinase